MATIPKKQLVAHVAQITRQRPTLVKHVVQLTLNQIIVELGKGNRLEFRDFGIFEFQYRKARKALNPKTMARVNVPPKPTVRFKASRLMKTAVAGPSAGGIESNEP